MPHTYNMSCYIYRQFPHSHFVKHQMGLHLSKCTMQNAWQARVAWRIGLKLWQTISPARTYCMVGSDPWTDHILIWIRNEDLDELPSFFLNADAFKHLEGYRLYWAVESHWHTRTCVDQECRARILQDIACFPRKDTGKLSLNVSLSSDAMISDEPAIVINLFKIKDRTVYSTSAGCPNLACIGDSA